MFAMIIISKALSLSLSNPWNGIGGDAPRASTAVRWPPLLPKQTNQKKIAVFSNENKPEEVLFILSNKQGEGGSQANNERGLRYIFICEPCSRYKQQTKKGKGNILDFTLQLQLQKERKKET